MATPSISRLPGAPRLARLRPSARVAAPAALALLLLLSLYLRTRRIDAGFWIDEGLSVGIASRPLTDIPGTLRLDGSPPLYYLLLHLWMQLFGDSEQATHALSVILTLVTIPVALWAGRSLVSPRAGWVAAGLIALNPFLTVYAQETRMYSLVVLCSMLATAAFLHAFVFGRRRYLPLFVVSLVAGMYAHNWCLFLGAAMGICWIALALREPERRQALVRTGLIGFGGVALGYAAWVPSLLYQADKTGAPWSATPSLQLMIDAPERLLGGQGPEMLLLLAAGAGVGLVVVGRAALAVHADGGDRTRELVWVLIALFVGTVALAWISSQISPAWANRYLAVGLGPLALLIALGLAANATRTALVAMVLVAAFWLSYDAPASKSNVRAVGDDVAELVQPGDLVVVTQPELVSAVAYYLPAGLHYATLTGRVDDVGVNDWVDGVERLENTTVEQDLEPLLDELPRGRRVLLVSPMILDDSGWRAPWTSLVRERSQLWRVALARDARFEATAVSPGSLYPLSPNPVRATLYRKTGVR